MMAFQKNNYIESWQIVHYQNHIKNQCAYRMYVLTSKMPLYAYIVPAHAFICLLSHLNIITFINLFSSSFDKQKHKLHAIWISQCRSGNFYTDIKMLCLFLNYQQPSLDMLHFITTDKNGLIHSIAAENMLPMTAVTALLLQQSFLCEPATELFCWFAK